MIVDRVIPAFATAGTLVGMGAVVIAQAVIDPVATIVDRVVGGSLLLVAAILIVRWTFRMWADTREALREDRNAALEREQVYLKQINELSHQLTAERQLRIGLERSGLTERRHPEDEV